MSRRRSRRIGEAGDELGNMLGRLAELQKKPGWNIGEEMGGDRREDGMSVEEAEEQMREEGDSSTELLGSSRLMEEQERNDCVSV